MKKKNKLFIVAYAAQGKGVSGGDRIFIEIARRLASDVEVHLLVSDEGKKMCQRMGLNSKKIIYHVSNLSRYRKWGAVIYNLVLVGNAVKEGFVTSVKSGDYVYSASEFLMDSLPALIWKLKNKNIAWIASWYQTAPSPLRGFSLSSHPRNRLSSVLYWFFQLTSKPYINYFADFINVNNKNEEKQFLRYKRKDKIFIMYGAVDTNLTAKYENKFEKIPKKYEAVFQGRFHPQKGVEELIDIWKFVVSQNKKAMLVMIGDGPLMKKVKLQIKKFKLQDNILLLGYVFDGEKKYKTFLQSKIVVHPAYYDSGGMASAEAMAFGLPAVGFDLPSYEDYYPKGMLKVPISNKKAFANAILKLLNNEKLYKKYSLDAKKMIYSSWSWEERVKDFWGFVNSKA